MVTRGEGGATYEEARDHALAAANKGLDFLCLRGAMPMAIRHPGTEHIVWWSEDSQSVVRLLSIPTLTLHVGKVTVTGGTPVAPAAPEWQESARYFRLSQLSDDLFDSFRNVYLALESILDHLAPQRTAPPLERAGECFRRALGAASRTGLTRVSRRSCGAWPPGGRCSDNSSSTQKALGFAVELTCRTIETSASAHLREPSGWCPGQGGLLEQHEQLVAGHTPDRM